MTLCSIDMPDALEIVLELASQDVIDDPDMADVAERQRAAIETVENFVANHYTTAPTYAVVMTCGNDTSVMLRKSHEEAKTLAGALWTAIADDENARVHVTKVVSEADLDL